MKNFAKLAAILLLLVAGPALWLFLKKSPQEKALHSRELATRRLAEHLARTLPGQRALVVSNPFAQARGGAILAQEEAGLRGLRQGFGKQIEIEAVVFPELKPAAQQAPESIELPPDATTPLSFMVTEDAFDKLAGQHPACKLMVSLIGLPSGPASAQGEGILFLLMASVWAVSIRTLYCSSMWRKARLGSTTQPSPA